MKSWLITGGLGFIGTNLAYKIRSKYPDDKIVSIDNNRNAVVGSSGIYDENFRANVCNLSSMVEIFHTVKPNVVIHLASVTEPRLSVKQPYKVMKENFSGALNVLNVSNDVNVDSVIVASSCGVAGEVPSYINRDSIAYPTNPYTHSKAIVESLCSCYSKLGLSVSVARFSNVYGPYSENKTSSIAKFCKDIINKGYVEIFGSGDQRRDFVYVGDLCAGIIDLADFSVRRRSSYRYCFASGHSTSINNIMEIFGSLAKGGFKIIHSSSNSFEICSIDVDISHTRLELHWQPETTLFSGISKTFLWFQDHMSIGK